MDADFNIAKHYTDILDGRREHLCSCSDDHGPIDEDTIQLSLSFGNQIKLCWFRPNL